MLTRPSNISIYHVYPNIYQFASGEIGSGNILYHMSRADVINIINKNATRATHKTHTVYMYILNQPHKLQ